MSETSKLQLSEYQSEITKLRDILEHIRRSL